MTKRRVDHHAEACREAAMVLIPALAIVARRHGYALAVHGSLSYDIDLVAVPWTEHATEAEVVAEAIRKAAEAIWGMAFLSPDDSNPTRKPHGRLAWSFHLGGGPYIDLSVVALRSDKAKGEKGETSDE